MAFEVISGPMKKPIDEKMVRDLRDILEMKKVRGDDKSIGLVGFREPRVKWDRRREK